MSGGLKQVPKKVGMSLSVVFIIRSISLLTAKHMITDGD